MMHGPANITFKEYQHYSCSGSNTGALLRDYFGQEFLFLIVDTCSLLTVC